MKLRWLHFEPGTIEKETKVPGVFFDSTIKAPCKFYRRPVLQYSVDGTEWHDVEDGPTIPFEEWNIGYEYAKN